MTLNYIKIEKEYVELYSPYSGNCFNNGEDEFEGEDDPTCLFIYLGAAGLWGYISPKVEALLKDLDMEDMEDMGPKIISKLLTIDGGVVFECNDGWNGTNWFAFAFAPALEE